MSSTEAIFGMVVLAAIPAVAYALWCDYFERWIVGQKTEREKINKPEILHHIRFATLITLLGQMTTYVLTYELRRANPAVGYGAFLIAVITEFVLQTGLEQKVRQYDSANPVDGKAHFFKAMRAFFWSTMAGALYLAVLLPTVLIFALPAAIFKAPPAIAVTLILAGVVVGVLSGLCVSFALSPFFIRKIFGATAITQGELHDNLVRTFRDAKMEPPRFWTIDPQQFHLSSAMMSGWPKAQFFISQSATESLSPEELRAVVLHEISHTKLQHLKKKMTFSAGLILCSSFMAGLLVKTAELAIPGAQAGGVIGISALIVSFAVAFRLLAEQTRLQEITADIYSIETLGCPTDALASALRKLDRLHDELPFRKDPGAIMVASGHPSTELRIRVLKKYFELKAARHQAKSEKDRSSPDKKAA